MMLQQQQQQSNPKLPGPKNQLNKKVNNYFTSERPSKESIDLAPQPSKDQMRYQSAPSTPSRLTRRDSDTGHFIERNVITKYAFATRVGFVPNNPNKVNQDSFILSPNMNSANYRHYFGVCDGHGKVKSLIL